MSSLPLIIIIDLDGTIIGDISPQIVSHELGKNLKGYPGKYNFDIKQFRNNLASGLIRPHFETFLKSLQAHYKNVEFFIYTASEKKWAEFVIKNIEATIGFKFNRPLFTRKECVMQDKDYRKGLCIVRKSIIASLKKKYGITYDKKDIMNNVLLIDNNNVYQGTDSKNLLLCPSYNYKIPENIPGYISQDVFLRGARVIHSIIKRYIPYDYTEDYLTFQRNFYTLYLQHLQTVQKANVKYINDRFWKQLKDLLISQNIRNFDERTVRFLNSHFRPQPIGGATGDTRATANRHTTSAVYNRLQQNNTLRRVMQQNHMQSAAYSAHTHTYVGNRPDRRKDTFY